MTENEYDVLWGTVRRTLERLRTEAPEGYTAAGEIRLADGETIEPAGVGQLNSWLYFEIDKEGDEVTLDRRIIFIPPELLARVEIRFVRTEGREIGFRVDSPRLAVVPERE